MIPMGSNQKEAKTLIDTTSKTLIIYSKISSKLLVLIKQKTKLFLALFEKIVGKNMDLIRCLMIRIFGVRG